MSDFHDYFLHPKIGVKFLQQLNDYSENDLALKVSWWFFC